MKKIANIILNIGMITLLIFLILAFFAPGFIFGKILKLPKEFWEGEKRECQTVYFVDRRLGFDEMYYSLDEAQKYAGGHVIKERIRCFY